MADFKEIIGHQNIIAHFQTAIERHKVGHAYLLNGPDRSGKRMLAEAFAETLQCEKKGISPCHACRACKQAESHNHPDNIYVQNEKPNVISVDDVRTQLVNDVGVKPYSGEYKVYIIDEAEKLNVQAQNAILKTIEEPPGYAVIMLLTNNADLFLQTILSRCIRLDLTAVPREEIEGLLMEKYGIPEQKAVLYSAFSQGNTGKAITLASSEDFSEIRSGVLSLLKGVDDWDLAEVTVRSKEAAEFKAQIQDYFAMLEIWYRDVLLYKATREIDGLTWRDADDGAIHREGFLHQLGAVEFFAGPGFDYISYPGVEGFAGGFYCIGKKLLFEAFAGDGFNVGVDKGPDVVEGRSVLFFFFQRDDKGTKILAGVLKFLGKVLFV